MFRKSGFGVSLLIALVMQTGNAADFGLNQSKGFDVLFRAGFEASELPTCQDAQDLDQDGLLDPLCIQTFLPPDPAAVATPIDPTVISDFWTINEFLIQSPNAIQRRAAPEAIKPWCAAIMRGVVRDALAMPLPGVLVRVLDHPEYGYTFTRADGGYDFLVNGGGDVVLDFQKPGFIRAQRSERTVWKDWTVLADVHLLAYDSRSTQVVLGSQSPSQVHRANAVTDIEGTRTSTLIIPAGTSANLVALNGNATAVSSLTVRATEYTVGDAGPKQMPASLPETSGYTYAVELSADEAIAAGARSVQFSQPLALYFENYLEFAVGQVIPVGYYDYVYGSWLPADNGRVIKVLGTPGGIAELDVDGSGNPASTAVMAAMGIDQAERMRLGSLYEAGQELWRTPISHFTPWDCNTPWIPERPAPAPPEDLDLDFNPPTDPNDNPGDDQETNPSDEPDDDSDGSADDEEQPECESGSIVECENARLREQIPLQGTPLALVYQSARTPSSAAVATKIRVKLRGETTPSTLQAIQASITVGGQVVTFNSRPPTANRYWDYVFPGTDAYGRRLQGSMPVSAQVDWVYRAIYAASLSAAEFEQAWAGITGTFFSDAQPNREFRVSRTFTSEGPVPSARVKRRGSWDARGLGNGGWSISEHHVYDPERRIVLKGDGTIRRTSVRSTTDVAVTVPYAPERLGQRVGADGAVWNLWRGSEGGRRGGSASVRATISRALVGGQTELLYESCPPAGEAGEDIHYCAEGSTPLFDRFNGHDVDERGDLYFSSGQKLLKLDAKTRAVSVLRDNAEQGSPCTITQIKVHQRRVYHLCQEGTIAMVWPNGSITPLALGGLTDGEDIPVQSANTNSAVWLDVDRAGNVLYVESTQPRLRKLGIDGRISTIAGNGNFGIPVDGSQAANSPMPEISSVLAMADGSFYLLAGSRVLQVRANGQVFTVLGGGNEGFDPSREQAARSLSLTNQGFIAALPDGSLIYGSSRQDPSQMVRIGGGSFRFDGEGQPYQVPNETGTKVWLFDARGRHLETRNALTGGLLLRFHYNPSGQLIRVEDGDGENTLIQRDGNGRATTVVSPYGQPTTLGYDAQGLLAQVDSVENRSWRLGYSQDSEEFGLLNRFENPRGHASTMEWAPGGRLFKDTNPEGGFVALDRQVWSHLESTNTVISTAAGRSREVWSNRSPGRKFKNSTSWSGGLTRSNESSTHRAFRVDRTGTSFAIRKAPDDRFGFGVSLSSGTVSLPQPAAEMTIERSQSSFASSLGTQLGQRDMQYQALINGRQYLRNYDAASRTWMTRSPTGRESTVNIDVQGRPVNIALPGLHHINYQYDARGRLQTILAGTAPNQRQWHFGYDSNGHLQTLTDPMLRVTTLVNDAAGRTTSLILPDTRQIGFGYDQNGNVTSITPPGRPAHTFVYNKVNRLTRYEPPVVPGISDTGTDYGYNLDKMVTSVANQGQSQITTVLEPLSLLIKHVDIAQGRYTYERSGTGDERITGFLHGNTEVRRVFNGPLLRQEQTWIDPGSNPHWDAALTWHYDGNHWLDSMDIQSYESQGGQTTTTSVDYDYDQDGVMTGATAGASTLVLHRNVQNGLLDGTTLGPITDAWGYNGFAEPTQYTASYFGTPLLTHAFVRDALGRISERTRNEPSGSVTETYAYDLAGRLDTVTRNGLLAADYDFDSNSNRTAVAYHPSHALWNTTHACLGNLTGSSTITITGTHDAQDRLLSWGSCTFTYSPNGELSSRVDSNGSQTTQYQYDVFGNLRQATLPDGTQLEYVIDGKNRRIGKRRNGTLEQGFVYLNQLEPIAETDGFGNVVATFVYADKPHVPSYLLKNGNVYRVISDYLGSVRLVINVADGQVAQALDYDEYGNVTEDTNPGFQPFGYAGGIYDRDLGFVRFGARDYDPIAGRWVSKDELGLGWNSESEYAYADNAPIDNVDLDGLSVLVLSGPPIMPRVAPLTQAIRMGLQQQGRTVGRPPPPSTPIEQAAQRAGLPRLFRADELRPGTEVAKQLPREFGPKIRDGDSLIDLLKMLGDILFGSGTVTVCPTDDAASEAELEAYWEECYRSGWCV